MGDVVAINWKREATFKAAIDEASRDFDGAIRCCACAIGTTPDADKAFRLSVLAIRITDLQRDLLRELDR